jgi:hypothetical protein
VLEPHLFFYLAQFSTFDTRDLKLFFFSFRNHKTLKSCRPNSNAFSLSKEKIHFSQVCFLFYFGISQIGYRKLDALIFDFASPESRNCELVFQFFTHGIDYGKIVNP